MPEEKNEEIKTETKVELKTKVKIDDFLKLDIRIGEVKSVEDIENADKLYKLKVDFGPFGVLQILSGIKEKIQKEDLIGRQFAFIVNLEARKMKGEVSEGMILATGEEEMSGLLIPNQKINNGDKVR